MPLDLIAPDSVVLYIMRLFMDLLVKTIIPGKRHFPLSTPIKKFVNPKRGKASSRYLSLES